MTPAWLLDLVAAVMLVVAAVSAGRLVAARPWEHGSVIVDTDVAHLLMAIAMAGMLTSSLTTLPNGAWEVIFGLLTAWFAARVVLDARASGVRALAGGHCAPHLVHSAAMLYMFLALAAPAGSGGIGGMTRMPGGSESTMTPREPTIAFLFALVLAGYSVWDIDRLSSRGYRGWRAARPALPAMAVAGVPALTVAEPGPAAVVPGPGFLLAPAVTVGCRIVMGVAMVFLLIVAL